MTRRLVLREKAILDLQQAAASYEAQRAGLGRDFVAQISTALDRLVESPESFAVVHRNAREAPVRRFSYRLYYQLNDAEIRVIAICHHARSPKVWQNRTDD
jgi:toxin ParE1/3/4